MENTRSFPGKRRSDRVKPGFSHTIDPCDWPAAKHQVFSWLSPGRLIGHLADLAFTRKKPGQLGNTSFFGKMSQKRLLFRPLPFDSKPFFVISHPAKFPPLGLVNTWCFPSRPPCRGRLLNTWEIPGICRTEKLGRKTPGKRQVFSVPSDGGNASPKTPGKYQAYQKNTRCLPD